MRRTRRTSIDARVKVLSWSRRVLNAQGLSAFKDAYEDPRSGITLGDMSSEFPVARSELRISGRRQCSETSQI